MELDQINDFNCYTSWVWHTPTTHEDELFEWQLIGGGLHVVAIRISRAKEGKYGFVKLNKTLYKLTWSSRAWYHKVDEHLLIKELTRRKFDHNLYFVKNENFVLFHMLYVDDLLITRNDIEKIKWSKEELKQTFEMTDVG
jgi:hypothetical protein